MAKCLRGLRGDGGEVPLHDMHEIGDEGHFARFTLHVIRRRSELALFNRIMEYVHKRKQILRRPFAHVLLVPVW